MNSFDTSKAGRGGLYRNSIVEVNGLKLNYLEWGQPGSPVILLLHGFLSTALIWHGFASAFSPDYRVLALDQRGHGESDWSDEGLYSIDEHFIDIARFIETLDLKDLILAGHSMGGRNALFYTACIPERVKKLVLVDARPGNSDRSVLALKNLLESFSFESGDLDDFIRKAEELYPDLSLKASFKLIFSSYKRSDSGRLLPGYDPWLVIASKLADYMVEELWPFMENIPCPTCIVRGERSTFISQEDAESMSRLIPDSAVETIPGSSHIPMLENPSAFYMAVRSFLEEV